MNNPSNGPVKRLSDEQKKLKEFHKVVNKVKNICLPDDTGYINEKHKEGMSLIFRGALLLLQLDSELKNEKNDKK